MICCDKAHHQDPVEATVVLTCADCGRVFARCSECQRVGPNSAQTSMKAHRHNVHARSKAVGRRRGESFARGHETDFDRWEP
jgi:hypothetical protein